MTDYSRTLTHKNPNRYQLLDSLLKEWDLNCYERCPDPSKVSSSRSKSDHLRVHGIKDQARDIQQLLAWTDTLRQPLDKTPLGKASTLSSFIHETRRHLKTLSHYATPDDSMPMLRVLSDTYERHQLPPGAKPEDIVIFLKELNAALNQPSATTGVDNRQRTQRKALETAIGKLQADFQQHPCLSFIHILLTKNPEDKSPPFSHPERNQRFLQYQKAFFAACRQGREPAFANLARYYWRLFADAEGNLQLWVIFAFVPTTETSSSPLMDGALIQHAEQIGQCWRETIKQGWSVALTENACAFQNHRSAQLGLVCRDDKQAIARLQSLMYTLEAIGYMGSIQVPLKGCGEMRQQRSQGNGQGRAARVKG